jgi:hypothetical protein
MYSNQSISHAIKSKHSGAKIKVTLSLSQIKIYFSFLINSYITGYMCFIHIFRFITTHNINIKIKS